MVLVQGSSYSPYLSWEGPVATWHCAGDFLRRILRVFFDMQGLGCRGCANVGAAWGSCLRYETQP